MIDYKSLLSVTKHRTAMDAAGQFVPTVPTPFKKVGTAQAQ
jgi:hypothetical protein